MSDDSPTLRVEFPNEESFRREFLANIAKGGIFVPTRAPLEVRDPVRVEIVCSWIGDYLTLRGEVVHRVPEELAATGATPGVAVQFQLAASELREQLARLAGVDPDHQPVLDERSAGSGRRSAARSSSHLPATIDGGKLHIDGRTRNLSSTGALLATDGAEVPVGTVVRLTVCHPTTDEAREVSGRVVRELRGSDGEVAAVGMHFEIPDAERVEFERFIEELKNVERNRRLGGITGSIGEVGITTLLQMFYRCAPQGTLWLERDADQAVVVFESGRLRLVTLGRTIGVEALRQVLEWRSGQFEFEARVGDDRELHEPFALEAVLIDAARESDEAGVTDEVLDDELALELELELEEPPDAPQVEDPGDALSVEEPANAPPAEEPTEAADLEVGAAGELAIDPDATLRVRDDGGDADELDKTQQAILDLARVGLSFRKALEIIPEEEAVLRTSLADLIERGWVALGED